MSAFASDELKSRPETPVAPRQIRSVSFAGLAHPSYSYTYSYSILTQGAPE